MVLIITYEWFGINRDFYLIHDQYKYQFESIDIYHSHKFNKDLL